MCWEEGAFAATRSVASNDSDHLHMHTIMDGRGCHNWYLPPTFRYDCQDGPLLPRGSRCLEGCNRRKGPSAVVARGRCIML